MEKQNVLNKTPKRVKVIGVPISAINKEMALNFISENFDDIRGNYVCASNAHTTVMAHEDSEYLKAQSESILSLPDGKPLAMVGKKKGFKEMSKISGLTFMQSTFTDERFTDKNHYFYGCTQETIDLILKNIHEKYPKLKVCGSEPSIFRELDDKDLNELIDRINKSNADFVWIGIGAPRQEKLMYRLKGKTNTIMTGVGGAFNILAGLVNDAPKWMQNIGLEWFYRLIKDPKRLFKRYLVTNSKFVWYNLFDKDKD